MRTPFASIIIPARNRSSTVARAVRSVLDQTVYGLEVIVVDDGSTDATSAVVEEIGDSRLRLLRLTENLGQSAARNDCA